MKRGGMVAVCVVAAVLTGCTPSTTRNGSVQTAPAPTPSVAVTAAVDPEPARAVTAAPAPRPKPQRVVEAEGDGMRDVAVAAFYKQAAAANLQRHWRVYAPTRLPEGFRLDTALSRSASSGLTAVYVLGKARIEIIEGAWDLGDTPYSVAGTARFGTYRARLLTDMPLDKTRKGEAILCNETPSPCMITAYQVPRAQLRLLGASMERVD